MERICIPSHHRLARDAGDTGIAGEVPLRAGRIAIRRAGPRAAGAAGWRSGNPSDDRFAIADRMNVNRHVAALAAASCAAASD
jgi:hypothetical protein